MQQPEEKRPPRVLLAATGMTAVELHMPCQIPVVPKHGTRQLNVCIKAHRIVFKQVLVPLAPAGSVASIKVPQLCELLVQLGCEVKVASTKSALYFFKQQQLPSSVGPIAGDEDEWHEWKAVGDPVMHIELRRWADAYVIAPLSANTLAKLANGLCDNLVTCIARAWDFKRPLLVSDNKALVADRAAGVVLQGSSPGHKLTSDGSWACRC